MSLISIAQKASTFQFIEPDYEEVIDVAIDLLKYLKENPSSELENTHRALKNLFWDVIMRIASINSFTTQKTDQK